MRRSQQRGRLDAPYKRRDWPLTLGSAAETMPRVAAHGGPGWYTMFHSCLAESNIARGAHSWLHRAGKPRIMEPASHYLHHHVTSPQLQSLLQGSSSSHLILVDDPQAAAQIRVDRCATRRSRDGRLLHGQDDFADGLT
mmetsp:Transcript_12279/g.31394  ORF Transcript_12279/g.31394 Transcript_12279/m.31394 type:complete len:139 (+) Transcript_12279:257-673(+)